MFFLNVIGCFFIFWMLLDLDVFGMFFWVFLDVFLGCFLDVLGCFWDVLSRDGNWNFAICVHLYAGRLP